MDDATKIRLLIEGCWECALQAAEAAHQMGLSFAVVQDDLEEDFSAWVLAETRFDPIQAQKFIDFSMQYEKAKAMGKEDVVRALVKLPGGEIYTLLLER